MDSKNPLNRPHDIVGLIQFTDKQEFVDISKKIIPALVKNREKYPVEWDMIVAIGTVGEMDILQIRLIKFKEDEQTILQTDNGNSGQ